MAVDPSDVTAGGGAADSGDGGMSPWTLAALLGILGGANYGPANKNAEKLRKYESTKERYSPWTHEHGSPVAQPSQTNMIEQGVASGLAMSPYAKNFSSLFGKGGTDAGAALGAEAAPEEMTSAWGSPVSSIAAQELPEVSASVPEIADAAAETTAEEGAPGLELTGAHPGKKKTPVVVGNSQPPPGPKVDQGSSATNAKQWNLNAPVYSPNAVGGPGINPYTQRPGAPLNPNYPRNQLR